MRTRLAVAVAVLALTAAPGAGKAAPAGATVYENANRFCNALPCASTDHSEVTIASGGTVTFVFADPVCLALAAVGCYHNVKTDGGGFPTTVRQPAPGGATVSLTLAGAGDYAYYCELHGTPMRGTIHVI